MQDIFPYTINYNIVPMNTKYQLDDKLVDVLLYTIEFPFVNLHVNINSFIYCSLVDNSNIKDNIKTYIQILEQLESSTTIDDINNIINESKLNNQILFGNDIWLLNDVNNISFSYLQDIFLFFSNTFQVPVSLFQEDISQMRQVFEMCF